MNKQNQAQLLANKCNELNIGKEDLEQLMSMFSKMN